MFPLASRIERNVNVDLDDTLRTKKALNHLGYLDVPSFGITEYPNEQLFEGITKFQNDNHLKVDGVMKPGGETAKKLGETMTQRFGSLLGPADVANDADDDGANPFAPAAKKPTAKKARRVDPLEAALNETLNDDNFWTDAAKEKAAEKKQAVRSNPFKLTSQIASNVNVDLDDSLRTKTALNRLGYLKAPEFGVTRYPNQQLFDAIEQFQKARGLKVDGVMKPGGPTERRLGEHLHKYGISIQPREPDAEDRAGKGVAIENVPNNARLAAGTDGDTKAESETMLRDGARMDEHGNWFDAKGKPIDNPNQNSNLKKTAAPLAAVPAAAAGLVAAGVITQSQLDTAMKRAQEAGKPLTDFLPDVTDLAKTPAGAALLGGKVLQGAMQDALGRTDVADPPPPLPGFPADSPKLGGDKTTSPQTDAIPGTPPSQPSNVNDNLPPSQDQSDDPDLRGGSIVEMKPVEEPPTFEIGEKFDPAEDRMSLLDPKTRELVRKVALSDGRVTEWDDKKGEAINVDTNRHPRNLQSDTEQAIRDFGEDPATVEKKVFNNHSTSYFLKNGIVISRRISNSGPTLEVRLPKQGKFKKKYNIKRRYKGKD